MSRVLRLALLATALPMAALAQDSANVHVGDRPGFGRIVFEFQQPTTYDMVREGDRVMLVFAGAPSVEAPAKLPHNVRLMQGGHGSATLLLAPGARVHPAGVGNRVVVDVIDPPGSRAPRMAAGRPVPGRLDALQPTTPQPEAPAADASPSEPAAAVPVLREGLPEPVGALAAAEPPATAADAPRMLESMVIPFEAGVGAAAFRRGGVALIVFDGVATVDEARLRRVRGFADAGAHASAVSTVVQVPLASGSVSLIREAKGWRLSQAEPTGKAVERAPSGPDILFKVEQPGRVVSVADPDTGQILLVGTANPAAGPLAGLATAGSLPGATVLQTWAGVAIEPFSDDVALRRAPDGFVLAASGGAAPMPDAIPAPAAALTRRFDFPDLAIPALAQRLHAAIAGAAEAPPRARTPGRLAVAQAMLALGLAAEAQSVLALVAVDDPAAEANPDVAGLSAIAALLAGRMDATSGLDNPALDGTAEIALWRGVRDAIIGHGPEAARTLPSLLPLALAYPQPLRDRVLPIVAEVAVLADAPSAAVLPDLPGLGLARAMQQERRGEVDAALAGYDALAAGRDQLDQVRAGARAVELRLAQGRITPAQAADALARQLAAWRGDDRELAARLRVADLQGQAKAWRPALELLRETGALFPDRQAAIHARMAAMMRTMLSGDGVDVAPLDLVLLAADFADCVPPGADGTALLTDKLLALDLPARARPLLQARLAATPSGPVRAGLGHHLASLQLDDGDAAGAERTIAATAAADLPERLQTERALLLAKTKAAQGDLAGATAGLAALATPTADDLRATLLQRAGDWPGSLAALNDLAGKVIPSAGLIPDGLGELVLRQASAAVQAGDHARLQDLGQRYAGRLTGPRADLFHLLTAAPVGGVGDLPRAAGEVALARAVPGRLQELGARQLAAKQQP